MKNAILPLLLLCFVCSCSSYVNNVHRQIDREEKISRKQQDASGAPQAWQDRYHPNSRKQDRDRRPVKNPVTYSLNDGGPNNQVRPPVKREYRPQRYQARDFEDNGSSGSLWANQGSSSSLFTYQNDKRAGDLVIINVLENLRNQISAELKRTFPDKKTKKKDDGKKPDAKAAAAAPAAPTAPNSEEMDMKVYDKISGTVMEEINQDYIVLRGRKDVIFKKEKKIHRSPSACVEEGHHGK